MNFGHSGATLTSAAPDEKTKTPYWTTSAYGASLSSWPDVVIIMLGTNDGTAFIWPEYKHEFEPTLRALVRKYQALASEPEVLLMVPPPLYQDMVYAGMLQTVINGELPAMIGRVARHMGLS